MSDEQYVIDSSENIDNIPDAIPSVVPDGTYLCQLAKAITQRTSRFDPNRHYFEWPMILQDAKGNKFDFSFNFSPKSPIFAEILKLAGGKEVENGIVKPPQNSIIGKYFMAEISKRTQKNDKSKFANEIMRVWAYKHKEEAEKKAAEEIAANEAEFPAEEDDPAF